ncbi:MAG: TIGR03943 family protein [bacterium]|nr:TIGR03943 family protein [bacterium]
MQITNDFQLITKDEAQQQNRPMEWLKAGTLLALSAYFGYSILSGNLTNYINIRFAWLSYLAVVIFAALGAASVYALLRNEGRARDDSHTPVSWSMIGLMALPLLMGTLIPSQPLGAEAVDGRIGTRVASVNTAAAVTKDPLQRNVLEWLRVFNDGSAPAAFDGQEADVIGFVYREPGFAVDQFMIARFTVACCVADASAIGLPVQWDGAADIADGEWVQVRGAFEAGSFRDQTMPILRAQSVQVVEQPEHPYVYP